MRAWHVISRSRNEARWHFALIATGTPFLLACVCLVTGCRYIISEPYPSFTVSTVSQEKLPAPVREAFATTNPGAKIIRMETSSFKGKIDADCIWFRSEDGKTVSAVLGSEGQSLPRSRFPPPGAADLQSQDALEAAKKERMYQQWLQKLREGYAQLETNLPEAELSLSNFDSSSYAQELSRGIFEANWIHSSFGLYWNEIPPPTIRGSSATVAVDKFIAENGWHMVTNDAFLLFTITERGKPILGLPWDVIRGRTFKAATHDGILYIPLRGYMPAGSSGLAYNPQTNRFRVIRDFKPIGDHWYVWSQTDNPSIEPSFYEGESRPFANPQRGAGGTQPFDSETNRARGAAASPSSP